MDRSKAKPGPPRAYYNDFEPLNAAWLRNLSAADVIESGEVDGRSIVDVQPDDLACFGQCHFFAGIGGWSLALRMAGWPMGREVWTGSCPCQPFSVAGKGAGYADERHLWPEFRRLIAKRRPATVFGEQVASRAGLDWLAAVRADLEAIGYAVWAADLCAAGAGAHHIRQRLWWVADAIGDEQPREKPRRRASGRVGRVKQPVPWIEPWCSALSRFRAVGDGLPRNVGGTDAARNAIVPQVAAEFIAAFWAAEEQTA